MAVIEVGYKFGGRSHGKNNQWQRTYSLKYMIQTDDKNTGPQAVLAALPSIGDSYSAFGETDAGSWVQSVEVSEDDDETGMQWTGTVNYGPFDVGQFQSDPSLWPIRVQWGAQTFERVIWFDINGDPITNSAYDRFDDPITIDQSRVLMTITRNEPVSGFDPFLAANYADKINSTVWNGFPAYWVKLGAITTSEPQTSPDGVIYYTVTYPFAIDRNKWKVSQLDQGFCELDSSSPPRQKPILDKSNQPLGEAVPLDGAGARLATNAAPVKLEFDVYDEIDFAGLNINLALRYGA